MLKKTVLLNPTAKKDWREQSAAPERIRSFPGKTIGFLDNSKPNAGLLLNFLRQCIGKHYENVRFINAAKILPARPLDDLLLNELAGACDLVVNGVGD